MLVLWDKDNQEGSCEDKAKFNYLGVIWGIKKSWRVHFLGIQESSYLYVAISNFD